VTIEVGRQFAMLGTAVDVLADVWWVGALAMGVALVLTPIVRLIAYRTKIVDRPDDFLKPHKMPVAYMGGVAICLGALAALAAFLVMLPDISQRWSDIGRDLSAGDLSSLQGNLVWKVLAFAVASVVITLVGLFDDILDISPRAKIYGQVGAAVILLVGGIGLTFTRVFASTLHLPMPPAWLALPMSGFICIIVVVATCNATNLLDGLDGLCGGVTAIVSLGFLALAVSLAVMHPQPSTDSIRMIICLALAGGVLGFLPYNIPPASIFLGDAGSMLLGFFVATMMALFCEEGHSRWFLATMAIYSLPILDTSLAVVRRLRSKKSIFTGDRSHLYDQLIDRGLSVKQVVGLFYASSTLAAIMGVVFAIQMRGRYATLIYVALLIVIWTLFFKKGMITPDKHREPAKGSDPPPTGE